MSHQKLFGQLRALLNEADKTGKWQAKVMKLVKVMHNDHPEEYAQEWVPYFQDYPGPWQDINLVSKLSDLAYFHSLFPNSALGVSYTSSEYPNIDMWDNTSVAAHSDRAFDALVQTPGFEQVVALILKQWLLTSRQTKTLFDKSMRARLQRLSLHSCKLEPEVLTSLFSDEPWESLVVLDLYFTQSLGTNLFDHLKSLSSESQIRELTLVPLKGEVNEDFEDLTRIVGLRNMTKLDLSYSSIGHQGIARLFELAEWPDLTSLTVTNSGLGTYSRPDSSVWNQLVKVEPGFKLESLNLQSNYMVPKDMERLVKSPWLRSVKTLNLSNNRVCDGDGIASLLGSKHLTSLERLNLSGSSMTRGSFKALGDAENMPTLKHLNVGGNRAGIPGTKAFVQRALLGQLESLNLSGNKVQDNGAKALAESLQVSQLRELDLNYNNIGEKGALALAESTAFESLEVLNLKNNPLSERAKKVLQNSNRMKKLKTLHL